MKTKPLINKLQKALLQCGYVVKINTRQFYSEEQNRMITMYEVLHPEWVKNKKEELVKRDIQIMKPTASQIDVVKILAKKYEELKNG